MLGSLLVTAGAVAAVAGLVAAASPDGSSFLQIAEFGA
jgi:hypothetical protein